MSKRYPDLGLAHLADEHLGHWSCNHCDGPCDIVIEPLDYESGVVVCKACARELASLLQKLAGA